MRKHLILVVLFIIGLATSAIKPHDYFTWLLEVFPAIIGSVILILTYQKFRFTSLTYWFILLHCYILFVGGHYTYAEVPAFNWLRDVLHQSRNNYDKIGHFAQGFVPAMIVRELFVRKKIINGKRWLAFLTVCVCMSISVTYEFIEWLVSVLSGSSGDSFLGTQGYVWDTQSDMLFATIGAITMVVLMSSLQDKAINRLKHQ
ncbi:DUF2238 domain-containing protein [Mucilaginibacter achroorhodeus]|uniref:DUF2238 domain-containing protein n=1 Tax=Mucilaginibacter achroorhodeus TaxID=2599294 RepID=A0A563U732_9SPHI|nr:DUF2238 domain-containing protein [Mucilaginibacter achroorhodeus]TWR27156.1 DUF2238 domain-containing protein [Mucilaginibacter achroorhodeus]